MSTRYPGGFITRNPVAPTSASASGIWTQDQVLQYVRSGTWPQVYVPIYIEDVFSTYLYTGDGSGFSINNGIDLSGKGGMVWLKDRTSANIHELFDTARGATYFLRSNATDAQSQNSNTLSSFNNNGFSIGDAASINTATNNYASWTFREQAKFFDVVTYTGNGSNRTIAHNLGSVPGCIIIKCTSSAADWPVYHRGLTNAATTGIYLNATDAAFNVGSAWWNSTAPTSTQFSVGTSGNQNNNGATYVAYLFAHDAGGFGPAGTDNVISCGSFTTDGGSSFTAVNLGYEPQWLLIKASSGTSNWTIVDNMRGIPVGSNGARLIANLTDAETSTFSWANLTATGFGPPTGGSNPYAASTTYIYIAIRRGPMKTPTSGTSVFGLSARSGTGANATVTGSAGVSDAVLIKNRGSAVGDLFAARLTGTGYLETSSTAAEVAAGTTILQANPWDVMDGVKVGTTSTITNATSNTYINYLFDRAPGFFDVVCITNGSGTGFAPSTAHNLGVTPELMIQKDRSAPASGWGVGLPSILGATKYLELHTTAASQTGGSGFWSPTSTMTGNLYYTSGTNGQTGVVYLFATVAGVSKVGSYTGTGTTLQVDCGFTAGSRFVMIKRTDSTGDWYVWDSARGIVAGNDPYLLMNSTAAEVTNTDYVDTYNAGFEISSTAPAAINASGGTFIFLAIA